MHTATSITHIALQLDHIFVDQSMASPYVPHGWHLSNSTSCNLLASLLVCLSVLCVLLHLLVCLFMCFGVFACLYVLVRSCALVHFCLCVLVCSCALVHFKAVAGTRTHDLGVTGPDP